jgi:hypothetical protein
MKSLLTLNEHQCNHRGMNSPLDPSLILHTAFGFWQSKVLLTAVEMGLFTKLADRHLTGAELGAELKLHPRGIADFFDALVAMKFLGREGEGSQAKYFTRPKAHYSLMKLARVTSGAFWSCSMRGYLNSGTCVDGEVLPAIPNDACA